MSSPLLWASEISDLDPYRMIDGKKFAQSVYAWVMEYKKNHPEEKWEIHNSAENGNPFYFLEQKDRHSIRSAHSLLQYLRAGDPLNIRFLEDGNQNENAHIQKDLENKLVSWMRDSLSPSQPGSFHELYGRAIVLCKGDLIKASALLWNVRSQGWQYAISRGRSPLVTNMDDLTGEACLWEGCGRFVVVPEENATKISGAMHFYKGTHRSEEKKLSTRIQFVISKRGDNFATAYHLFGVNTLALYMEGFTGSSSLAKTISKTAVNLEALLHLESAGPRYERLKRIGNDRAAAEVAAELKRCQRKKNCETDILSKGAAHYLESKPGRLHKNYPLEMDGRSPSDFRIKTEPRFLTGPMGLEELKMRFEYALYVDRQIFHRDILALTRDGERLVEGIRRYKELGAPDADLNRMIKNYLAGGYGRVEESGGFLKSAAYGDFALTNDNRKKVSTHLDPNFDLEAAKKKFEYELKEIEKTLLTRAPVQAPPLGANCPEGFKSIKP